MVYPLDLTMDGHVHTRLCMHAAGTMEEYVQAAIHRGLASICFLEHLEVEIHYSQRSWLRPMDFEEYFKEGQRLKKKYAASIKVMLGAEAGFNPLAVDSLCKALQAYPFERVGLSYHFYHVDGIHYNLLSRNKENVDQLIKLGVDQILGDYFQTLTEAVQLIDCDVLCHLDAVLRHVPGLVLSAKNQLQITALLEQVQHKGIALELNTSGIDQRGTLHPENTIIAEAMQLNIPLTLGSDAHAPEQVGRYFTTIPALLDSLSA